jgi:hypothetical protein
MSEAPSNLSQAEACYRRGDFLEARKIAKAIAASADSPPEEKERAAKILKATGADPVAIAAFLVTALLLAFLIAHYVL